MLTSPIPMRRAVLLGLGASIVGGVPTMVRGAGEALFIDASGVAPGSLPDGFAVARTGQGAPAAWAVQEDASVPRRRVISQTSTDQTDYRFPLAIYEKLSVMDLDVKVHFKAVGGRVDRAGGIAIRLVDPNNYYVVRANALEDNVNFYHVVNGTRRQIRGASTKVTSDVWHTLGIRAERQEFTISFDGKSLFSVQDRTFTNAGKVALWTKADSVTSFDALEIRTLP
jgi:hypothetical protein